MTEKGTPKRREFEWVEYPNGSSTVRDVSTGEVMHSKVGPWEEAQALYIQQSRLSERLLRRSQGQDSGNSNKINIAEPIPSLVVYDVGMGIAANAWAAIEARLALGGPDRARPLRIISFENQLDGLRLALEQPERTRFLSRAKPSLEHLLAQGSWRSEKGEVEWELRLGDFFENLRAADHPEVVFYDFYAPRACPDLWSVPSLEKLRAACEAKDGPSGENRAFTTDLYTYSAATPVRTALLLAGFYVGYGIGTSEKNETTIASTRLEKLERPLAEAWLSKLSRSDRPLPWGRHSISSATELLTRLRRHPQFNS